MTNFPIEVSGREYWVSRSVAVVILFTAFDKEGTRFVLAVQRGKGTSDVEKYCLPCGYLDYNETTKEAAARELREETGIERDSSLFSLIEIIDDPKLDKRQNINFIFRFISNIPKEIIEKEFTTEFSEKDEISSIKFIKFSEIDSYEWAFKHNETIKKLCFKI